MLFQDLTPQHWTNFWKELTPSIEQNDKRLTKYRWSSVRRSFTNIGIDKETVNNAQTTFNGFREMERQMLRFNRFFVGNRDVLQECLGVTDVNETFLKILELFADGDHEDVRQQLENVRILKQLDKRGEGNEYMSADSTATGLEAFDVKRLQRRLSRVFNRKYQALAPIECRGWNVYPFAKKMDWTSYLFVQLQKKPDGTIIAKISASDIENIIIRSYLAKIFGIYFGSLEEGGSFGKLMTLLQKGESEHFILKSAGFISGDFIISVRRKFSGKRFTSLGSSSILKRLKQPDQLDQLILKHKNEKLLQRPIVISASTFRNAKVIGAIILNFRDRNFKAHQREGVRSDFRADFEIPLGTFIRYQEPTQKELCQLFLENEVRRKTAHIGVRLESTKGAWDLYLNLVKLGILNPDSEEAIVTSYCFDRSCDMRYKSQDTKREFCSECGNPLCNKNDITVGSINEKNIVQWLQEKAKKYGFETRIVQRKILSKTVFILEVEKKGTKMNFMAMTSDPNEHFLEVLAVRYPDVCILTSKDNIDIFTDVQIHAVRFYEFFHDLEIKLKQILTCNSRKIRQKVSGQIVHRAESAIEHLQSDDYYIEKSVIVKNLGAELFEADCHGLLKAMFGSSIWLGAKSRGQAVPDGRSAFPYFPSIGIDKGCFAWDTKFTIKQRSKIGEKEKNQKYVQQLYKDSALRGKNSRGLLFISNKIEQKTFRAVALKIAGRRRVKILYMQAKQLVSVYQHYIDHKQTIEDNENAKKAFFMFARNLLTSTSQNQGGKVFAVNDEFLNDAIRKNKCELRKYE